MESYKELRNMQRTYLAASKNRVAWEGDRSLGLAKQISILAGYLADMMIPIESPPPTNDDYVAIGCRLFSDPFALKLL